jgi:beta-phosphoglucomutase-like phosphatase (HAD superfamily)
VYKAAIFDMDGLLIDSERAIRDAWLEVARRNQVALSEADYLRVVGRNESDAKAILDEVFCGAFSFENARSSVTHLLSERYAAHGFPAKPGAFALLSRLRGRAVPCCVASSTRSLELRRRLDQSALLAFFGALCGGDEVANGKPSPDLFLLASERLGVEPEACLVFEDSEHGVIGAAAAGMSAVFVPDLKTADANIRANCLSVLRSLDDALPLCDAWFAARNFAPRATGSE